MYRGGSKLLPIALVAVVIIVAIIAVVALGRALLNRNAQPEPVDDSASRALVTSDADHSVRMTVRGPIVAEENFNSYQIEVSPIGRRMTTYRGYDEQIIEDVRLGNTTEGYVEFTHALNRLNFSSEIALEEPEEDMRGVCPTGRLYTFEILQAQSVIKELWTSSCRKVAGSFGGDAVQARSLFLKQIPESNAKLRDLDLQ